MKKRQVLFSILSTALIAIFTSVSPAFAQTTSVQHHPSFATAPKHKTAQPSIKILSFTQDVSPGDYADIDIQTTPGAYCTIEVDYYSGPSRAKGLYPENADRSGHASWEWKVGTRTYAGNWPVIITAGGKTIQTTLHVH